MIKSNKTLVIIPARGGSKGVPGKNIKPLGGKPLIYYTIDAARQIVKDTDICMSSDSSNIIQVVENYGLNVPFKRPDEFATDKAGSYQVLLHAIDFYEAKNIYYENIILLQPTSPFRTGNHIKEALKLYDNNVDMVVSVTESKNNPYYNLFEEGEDGFLKQSKKGSFIRRQDCPKVWEYNGALYIIKVSSLKNSDINEFEKIVKYEMNDLDSLDIDTELDWKISEIKIMEK